MTSRCEDHIFIHIQACNGILIARVKKRRIAGSGIVFPDTVIARIVVKTAAVRGAAQKFSLRNHFHICSGKGLPPDAGDAACLVPGIVIQIRAVGIELCSIHGIELAVYRDELTAIAENRMICCRFATCFSCFRRGSRFRIGFCRWCRRS